MYVNGLITNNYSCNEIGRVDSSEKLSRKSSFDSWKNPSDASKISDASNKSLVLYSKRKDDTEKDDENPLFYVKPIKSSRLNRILSVLDSLPYSVLGAHLGISDPSHVKKLMPDSIRNKLFTICFRVSWTMISHCLTDEDVEYYECSDYLDEMERLRLKGGHEPNKLQLVKKTYNYSFIQREQQRELISAMNSIFLEMGNWFKHQFLAVGVNSFREYEKKLSYITTIRALAEQRYLGVNENLEQRKNIDLALWKEKEMSKEEFRVVTNFWESVLNTSEGVQVHLSLEKQLHQIIVKAHEKLYKVSKDFRRKLCPRAFQREPNFTSEEQKFDFPQYLFDSSFSSVKWLLEESYLDLSLLRSFDEEVAGKYFVLKSNRVIEAICKRQIRDQLESLVEKMETKKNTLIAASLAQKAQLIPVMITYYKESLSLIDALINDKECDHPNFAELKAHWISLPEDQRKIEGRTFDGKVIGGIGAIQEALQKFEDYQKLGNEEWLKLDLFDIWLLGEGPKKYQSMLEKVKDPPSDRLWVQCYMIELGEDAFNLNTRENIVHDVDISCDLTATEDPLRYLENTIQARDEKKLALLFNKADVNDVSK